MTNEQKTIVVVDDNNANLIAIKNILKSHYVVYPAPSAEKMFELMEHVIPDLILLDVEMPGMDGHEAIKKLKNNDAFKHIPVVFLSARSDATSEMEGLGLGALDYLHKPFYSALLLKRIEIHLSLIEYEKFIEELLAEKTKLSNELDMVKIEAGKFELSNTGFNFKNMLFDIIEECNVEAKEKKQELAVNLNEDLPVSVTGDELRLSQVFTNLLLNAVNFTPENGKIDFTVEKAEETDDEFILKVHVADNGAGIPDDKLKNIFVFDNKKYGLVISRHIVELMGGKIWIESKPGRGTKVTFTVKVKKGQ